MTRRSVYLLVALAATLVAAEPPVTTTPEAGAVANTGGDAYLLQSVRVVNERVAALVGAARVSDVVAQRADDATRLAEANARASRILSADVAAARGRAWRDLGLGAGSEPRDLVAAIESDLSGMTFDASRRRLLVDPGRVLEDAGHGDPNADADASILLTTGVAPDEPVVGHYLAHALLDARPGVEPASTDALLARAALSEGSANLAALELLFGGVGLESEVRSGAVRPEDVLGGRLVPEGIRSATPVVAGLLQFVYLDGFAQAASIARQGGWARLAQERGRRLTTRDVLHVDRPAGGEVVVAAPTLPPELDLALADRDTLGEQGIVTLVSLLTGKDNLGLIAGDGWLADGVWRYEPGPGSKAGAGEGVTIWVSRWQTEEDAKDLVYAIERCLAARFSGETIVDDPERGGRRLTRQDRVYRLDRNGLEVAFRVVTPATDAKMAPKPKKKGTERPPVRAKS